ncbi:OmpP1/FadL family transporter [Shewanella sp.]|uniref:OmpP1/FadL family transporter n=1 Tax=Shewanella sp. TaxID=50422 RepID=UPI001EC6FFA0|nr:outer membrane protein transport protein [Shewanella sp.]NRB25791.1 outer membrane protein transport protein [Shewanella sp.]
MQGKYTAPLVGGLVTLLSSVSVNAAGLSLSQIATTESIAMAGVAGVTNNRDSSAMVTNPAGLTGIEDSSYLLGAQVIIVDAEFNNNLGDASSSSTTPIPHLSYAQRVNDKWVLGGSVHAPGGLGLEYKNGLFGANTPTVVNESAIEIVDFTFAAAYQLDENWSLGAAVIAQYASIDMQLLEGTSFANNLSDQDINFAFSLGAQYQLDNWLVGISYKSGSDHEFSYDGMFPAPSALTWPQIVDIGVSYQATERTQLSFSMNWQEWSASGDSLGYQYQDTYGVGIAIRHQLDEWVLMAGASYDSSPIDTAADRTIDLPLDSQWRIGFGAEKKIWGDKWLGIAYQYSDLGQADILMTGPGGINTLVEGSYSKNRAHFITASLRY